MGWSENGGIDCLAVWLEGQTPQTNLYVALVTSAVAPGTDTLTLGDLTQIATSADYLDGGITLSRNATDFPDRTLDDANNIVGVQIKDLVWTGDNDAIPASGGGARYAVLTGHNATASLREVFQSWDLVSDRTVSLGQSLTLQNCEIQIDVG